MFRADPFINLPFFSCFMKNQLGTLGEMRKPKGDIQRFVHTKRNERFLLRTSAIQDPWGGKSSFKLGEAGFTIPKTLI